MQKLQPQDVVLAVYLCFQKDKQSFATLSTIFQMSASQLHSSYKRLIALKLLDKDFEKPLITNLSEFLCHGIRYVFPAELSGIGNGRLTGISHPDIKKHLTSAEKHQFIWESVDEPFFEGVKVSPIHRSILSVSRVCEKSYRCFALIDVIRIGKAREREVAIKLLKEVLNAN